MNGNYSNEQIDKIVNDVLSEISSKKTVKNNSDISLKEAELVIKAVEKKAAEIGVNAVVAVSNSGANPVAVHCMDDSFIASYDIALNKSFTVVALKMSTSALKNMAQPGQSLYGIQFTNNGKIVIFGGGEPLKYGDKIIGGLGVSGGTEEQDTFLAQYGEKFFKEAIANHERE